MLYLHQQPIYSTLMAILTITNVYNHMVETKTSALIDKIAVYIVVLYGGFIYYHKKYNKSVNIIIVACFLASGFIYYLALPLINNPIYYVYLHGLMHFIASAGHHFIA